MLKITYWWWLNHFSGAPLKQKKRSLYHETMDCSFSGNDGVVYAGLAFGGREAEPGRGGELYSTCSKNSRFV
jgi:hypothetical protein